MVMSVDWWSAADPSITGSVRICSLSPITQSMLEDRSEIPKHAKLLQKNGSNKITVE
jgi:hypothetical protein